MSEVKPVLCKQEGKERVIFTPKITRNGRTIYAKNYGLKAFRIVVRD